MTFRSRIGALLFLLTCTPVWLFGQASSTFVITDFGALGDGQTLNTTAIQRAIDTCLAQGGGRVHCPAGTFLTGGLRLGSHLELHLAAGCTLLASSDIRHYPDGVFITADSLQHVALTGLGVIDGQGDAFYDENFEPGDRPEPFIRFHKSEGITVRDLTIQHSPSHVLVLRECQGALVDGLTIRNHPQSPNTDGIDITSTSDVRIANCLIATGDDAICLKAHARPVEYVTVTNCILESDDAALKCGTGSQSAVRHCVFSNNVIRRSRYGVALFMLEGGVYEHLLFSQISFEGGSRHPHEYPIFVDIDRKRPTDALGQIRHVVFSDWTVQTTGKFLVAGHPQAPLRYLTLRNLHVRVTAPADFGQAKKPRGNKRFPALPSSADFSAESATWVLAHAEHCVLEGIRINYDTPPPAAALRHAASFRHVRQSQVRSLHAQPAPKVAWFSEKADLTVEHSSPAFPASKR